VANPHKGEVSFKVGEDSYKLSFSADALAEVEDALGMSVSGVGEAMQNPETFRLTMVRTLFWGGLLDHHQLDLKAARAIFRQLTVAEAVSLIGRAFNLAFPQVAEGESGVDPQKPGNPADGTGLAF
jgi:hypothetical protein